MSLDPNALLALREALKEGDVKFRFEGMFKGKVARWVELTGKREGAVWSASMKTGDGRVLTKTGIPDEEAERHFTEALLTIGHWMDDGPRS